MQVMVGTVADGILEVMRQISAGFGCYSCWWYSRGNKVTICRLWNLYHYWWYPRLNKLFISKLLDCPFNIFLFSMVQQATSGPEPPHFDYFLKQTTLKNCHLDS